MCVCVCAQTLTSGAVRRANRRFVHTQTSPTQSKLMDLRILYTKCVFVFFEVAHCHTAQQTADILTKPLLRTLHERHGAGMRVSSDQ